MKTMENTASETFRHTEASTILMATIKMMEVRFGASLATDTDTSFNNGFIRMQRMAIEKYRELLETPRCERSDQT
jgi:hypothetical protein